MTTHVMKTPKRVDISITGKCNLRCLYCSHFESEREVDDLPAEEWLRFFSELKECAVLEVCLEGGEPFSRKDLDVLIEGIVKSNMRFSILSNGTLITSDMAAFIASTRRCNYVQVSIDGSMPSVHDACRGEGSFARALTGLGLLREKGINTAARVTIHKYNVHDLENVARFLLDDMGLSSFGTNSAGYLGVCRRNSGFVQLSAEERTLAMEALLRLDRKYPGRISAMAGPLAEGRSWLNMEERRVKDRGENKREKQDKARDFGGGRLSGCGGMWEGLGVRADGVMVPCLMLGHMELGRINRDSLRQVWQTHPELEKLRNRHVISLSDFEYCKGCDYIDSCTGNCPGLAWTLAQNAYHPSPDACLKRFLEAGGRLPDMQDKGKS